MPFTLDCYDAITVVEARDDVPCKLLGRVAHKVADLWNDPPRVWQEDEVRRIFPELAEALDELLGGGPVG